MDQVIRQFADKAPVDLLDKHKRCMHMHMSSVFQSIQSVLSVLRQSGPSEDCIMTGSLVEGASLARLFSPDHETSSEIEMDMMIPLMKLHSEEALTYIDNSKAFAHIMVNSRDMEQVRSYCDEDAVRKAFYQKEDGTYVSNQVLQIPLKQLLAQSPNIFSMWAGGRPYATSNRCEAGNAAISLTINVETLTGDGNAAEESQDGSECASAATDFASSQAQKSNQLVNEVKQCCEEFNIKIAEMFPRLERVQGEFMEMRSEELSSSVYDQASKALEWAEICLDITGVIFNTRQSVDGRFLSHYWGVNIGPMIEAERERVEQKLRIYINQLTISKDGTANDVSAAAVVAQVLSDIEHTDAAGFLTLFQKIVKLQTCMNRILMYLITLTHYFDLHPQPWQIPEPLRQLSRTVKRISIDMVPCLKLMFWPSVAAEWKTRDRLWPRQSVIDGIVGKGAHVVAKEFCHEDIDWRLSFSVAEIDLATRWSPAQHFVYFVFKSLFYKFVKPLSVDLVDPFVPASSSNKKYVASYTAKTVMMWTSESVDRSWWTEDDAGECLTVLLLALQSAFECRTLQHYFVPSVNLLQGVPDVLASRVVDTVESILAHPAAVVAQLESHFENIEVFFNAVPEQTKFAKPIANFGKLMSMLLRVSGLCNLNASTMPGP